MNRGVANFAPRVTQLTKADVTAATAWTTGNSPVTIFTVTGSVLITCCGVVTTAMTSTGATGTLALGVTGSTGLIIAATTVNGTNLNVAKQIWTGTTANVLGAALPSTSSWFAVSDSNIILTIATNSMTAGGMNLFGMWIPLSAGASVV